MNAPNDSPSEQPPQPRPSELAVTHDASEYTGTIARPTVDTIDLPAPRRLIAIDRAAWQRLRTGVAGVGATGTWRQNAGWFFAAMSVSFFVPAISEAKEVRSVGFEIWLSVICVILAGLLLVWGALSEKTQRTRIEDVLLQVEEIERTFLQRDCA